MVVETGGGGGGGGKTMISMYEVYIQMMFES